jgi:hypothetical protein
MCALETTVHIHCGGQVDLGQLDVPEFESVTVGSFVLGW